MHVRAGLVTPPVSPVAHSSGGSRALAPRCSLLLWGLQKPPVLVLEPSEPPASVLPQARSLGMASTLLQIRWD